MKRQAYYILDQGEAILPTDEYFSNGGWCRTGGDSQFVRDLAYRRPIPDAPTPAIHPLFRELRSEIAPEPQWLPLGPDDVPPGSVLRFNETDTLRKDPPGVWTCIASVCEEGVVEVVRRHLCDPALRLITFEDLMPHEIKRPGEDWQPCKKLAK